MSNLLTESAFTHGGVDFWIADVGPDKPGYDAEYSHEASGMNLTLRVDWDARFDARMALLGRTDFIRPPGAQWGYFSRTLPHEFTELDEGLFCKRVTLVPEISRDSPGAGVPGALFAILKARYESPPYNLLLDSDILVDGVPDESTLLRFISRPPPVSKDRVFQSPAGMWKFEGETDPIPKPIGIGVPESEETLVWHQVPLAHVPYAAISARWACSNDGAFAGWPDQTLVFTGYSFRECPRLSTGDLAVNIHYTFTRKPKGANSFPDSRRGNQFYPVTSFDGSNARPHTPANFAALFRPV